MSAIRVASPRRDVADRGRFEMPDRASGSLLRTRSLQETTMANENSSRDNPSRQQSAERSQTGTAQQGTGASYGQGTQGGYQGSQGQGGMAQGGHGQGNYGGMGQGRSGQSRDIGTSTWQGGRPAGGPLTTRGGSSLSPYFGSGYGSGPFSVMRRISDEMDRLFENFGMGRGLFGGEQDQGRGYDVGSYGQPPAMWSPHVEVFERGGKLVIQADLPGMKREDIHVRVEDGEVILQGERRQEQTNNQGGYYRSERSYGVFYRTIPLPEGTNAESANATFRDGVLEIELDAPRQQQRGRTLEIRDAASHGSSASGTGSGATYGSGTTGSMQGTSGTSSQHLQSGTGTTQHSASGTSGTQHSEGSSSGTMYSGSGNPSVGAAGMGGSQSSPGDKSRSST
jgi:HSP20 family protein